MANIPATNISSLVAPFTTEDTYPSHDSQYGKGGWREVATTAERDAISSQRRTEGMAVYVTGEDKLYILNADLTTWTEFTGGTSDHTQLSNRNVANQHNISSITDLQTTLDTKLESYTYEQGVASAVWNVQHNLDRYPSVSVVDSAGNEVTCSVEYIDTNNCTLTMNGAFKGKAYFN